MKDLSAFSKKELEDMISEMESNGEKEDDKESEDDKEEKIDLTPIVEAINKIAEANRKYQASVNSFNGRAIVELERLRNVIMEVTNKKPDMSMHSMMSEHRDTMEKSLKELITALAKDNKEDKKEEKPTVWDFIPVRNEYGELLKLRAEAVK